MNNLNCAGNTPILVVGGANTAKHKLGQCQLL
jgi:hypothetical protein